MNAHRRIVAILLAVTAIAFSHQVQATSPMTVDEAYRAIPHQRTVFDPTTAKMDRADAEYLQHLFLWIDQAIVAKMTAMRNTPADQAYSSVWAMQSRVTPGARFTSLQATVADSIKHEYEYLKQRQTASVKAFKPNDPHVQAASQRAQHAYAMLLSMYPNETAHNKQAFYDYLCALDFL